MTASAIEKVRSDAVGLLGEVVAAYAKEVADGEVGAAGTAQAAEGTPVAGRCPTGLLYGRVQSGKTVAMICFSAAALDNGFRVIVVLTSDFVKLVEQTAQRFMALDGPLIKSSIQSDTWGDDSEHVRKHVATNGVVFVCAKNQQRLATLVTFLREIGAEGFPALVLDDEADQATLDTTTAARTSGKASAPAQASAIHRKTVQNDAPSEEGQSIRETLRHHVFLQVTATPYALLLQNIDNPLRPSFSRLLEPGDGYTGGESFFDVRHVEDADPPLVFVSENESAEIEDSAQEAPEGLQQAIAFFLVSAAAQFLLEPPSAAPGQNFLCHTSHKQVDHDRLALLIREFLNRVGDELAMPEPRGVGVNRIHWAIEQLKRTLPDPPAVRDLFAVVKRRLPRREVLVINSGSANVQFGQEMNFLIGGNILGRGLTIENLLVTYYLRRAKISQMDTVLQHARMYGYRRSLMRYTRVFLPEDLALKFHHIHNAEQSLRSQLVDGDSRSRMAVATLQNLRATRLNVLDTGSLCAFEPGSQVYPGRPRLDATALNKAESLERKVREAFGGRLRASEFLEAPIDVLIELINALPYDPQTANSWDPDLLSRLLEVLAPRYDGKGFVFYRTMSRKTRRFVGGALSGPEFKAAVAQGRPVVCAFRDDGAKLTGGREFWYPTLVLPENMPNQVFNTTA